MFVTGCLQFGAATSDRVTSALTRTPDAVSFLLWHYPTTQTALRRLWGRTDSATYSMNLLWTFAAATTLNAQFDRTSGTAQSIGNKTYALNHWWFNAVTLTVGAAPKIFWGDLLNPVQEDTYSSTSAGTSGSLKNDGAVVWAVGNSSSATVAYQGNIAMFARVDQDLSTDRALLNSLAFNPRPIVNTAALYVYPRGSGFIPDRSGNNKIGTVTGTVSVNANLPRVSVAVRR